MKPSHQNIAAAVLTVIYVKIVVGGCDVAVSKKLLPSKITRKIVHIAAASWLLFWPLFDVNHITWMSNICVPAVYTLTLLYKGLTLKRNTLDTDVKTMTRTGNPKELLLGPIHFTVTMCICGIWFFRQEEAIIIMSCLGFGDGIAPLFGQYFPYGKYPTYPFGMNDKKTLSGSLAFFIGSICGKQAKESPRVYFLRIKMFVCLVIFFC